MTSPRCRVTSAQCPARRRRRASASVSHRSLRAPTNIGHPRDVDATGRQDAAGWSVLAGRVRQFLGRRRIAASSHLIMLIRRASAVARRRAAVAAAVPRQASQSAATPTQRTLYYSHSQPTNGAPHCMRYSPTTVVGVEQSVHCVCVRVSWPRGGPGSTLHMNTHVCVTLTRSL